MQTTAISFLSALTLLAAACGEAHHDACVDCATPSPPPSTSSNDGDLPGPTADLTPEHEEPTPDVSTDVETADASSTEQGPSPSDPATAGGSDDEGSTTADESDPERQMPFGGAGTDAGSVIEPAESDDARDAGAPPSMGDASTPSDPAPSTPEEPGFELAATGPWHVRQGEPFGEFDFELTRDPGFTELVHVTMTGLPSGVFAGSAYLDDPVTKGTLPLQVALTAPLGHFQATLHAEVPSGTAETIDLPIDVKIGGRMGSFDTRFGDAGEVRLSITGGEYDAATDACLDSRGRLLVAGARQGDAYEGWLVRLTEKGVFDQTFANGGILMGFGSPESWVSAVAADETGLTVGAGARAAAGSTARSYLRRLNDDGSIDTTFGTGGDIIVDGSFRKIDSRAETTFVQLDFNVYELGQDRRSLLPWTETTAGAQTFVIDDNGRMVIGWGSTLESGDVLLNVTRLTTPETPDPAFGNGGTSTSLGPVSSSLPLSKIHVAKGVNDAVVALVGTRWGNIYENEVALLSIGSGGVLDGGFGIAGRVLLSPRASTVDVVVLDDGSIIAMYLVEEDDHYYWTLHRVDSSGVNEPRFGDGGTLVVDGLSNMSLVLDRDNNQLVLLDYTYEADTTFPRVRRLWL